MKILVTGDLHCRRAWFDWLERQIGNYDLLCLCGDLLNLYSNEDPLRQMLYVHDWFQGLNGKSARVALCSGPHDGNDEPVDKTIPLEDLSGNERAIAAQLMNQPKWMDAIPGRVIADGRTDVIKCADGEGAVVTTCRSNPLQCADIASANWTALEEGYNLRIEKQLPWMILRHDANETEGDDSEIKHLLESFQPDFLLCGHGVESAEEEEFCLARAGETVIVNAGFHDDPTRPPVVRLDTVRRSATWTRMGSDRVLRRSEIQF